MSIFHPFVWLFQQFTSLFNSIKKEWLKLSAVQQQALIHGSGVIDVIAKDLDKPLTDVLADIQKLYPNIPTVTVINTLIKTAKDLGIQTTAVDSDLSIITDIQNYLKTKEVGKPLWSALAELAAVAASYFESGLSWQTIRLFGEFVYQHFIKES